MALEFLVKSKSPSIVSFTETLSIENIAPAVALNKKLPLALECVNVNVKVPLLVIIYIAEPELSITLACPKLL